MKTLLTGSSGLVGSTINAEYKFPKGLDLRSWENTWSFFKDKDDIDAIVHCAAKVGGVKANSDYPYNFYLDNILMNTHLIEACRMKGIKKVILFLSTCVFPNQVSAPLYPLQESNLHDGIPHGSNYGYAYAKRMVEVQTRALYEQEGLKYICVMPTNIYGPNDNFSLNTGHVIPSLIHKCYLAKKNKTDFVVWGSGKPLREFIFSYDVSRIIWNILDRYEEADNMILSPSQEVSISSVAETIADLFGFEGKIVYDDSKPDGQFRKPSYNGRLKDFLPEFEFTPLSEGLKTTIDWFNNNIETYRQ